MYHISPEDLKIFANQVVDTCGSTNDIAKKLAEAGYPHGTWISSRKQTSGRGRMGRQWESEEGNLFLSLIVRAVDLSRWSWIPLTSAIGVVRLLRSTYSNVHFKIKWPNDIWVHDAKLGGILCETVGQKETSAIIIGIGLNCLWSPQGLDQKTIDLKTEVGENLIDLDALRKDVTLSVLNEVDHLHLMGPERVQESYGKWAQYPEGSQIHWGSPPQLGAQTGIVKGLGSLGQLLVYDSKGELRQLFSEDLTGSV